MRCLSSDTIAYGGVLIAIFKKKELLFAPLVGVPLDQSKALVARPLLIHALASGCAVSGLLAEKIYNYCTPWGI